MTLGGLALAVGILVDDATVTIENINWHLEQGKEVEQAILDGAEQIVVPAFVSLLCICIVFVPMFFLTGVPRFLFVPLAEAVMSAMVWSFILSRTLVPTMAKYLLRKHEAHANGHGSNNALPPTRNPLVRFQRGFEARFERGRLAYRELLTMALRHRTVFTILFLTFVVGSFALAPYLGRDFFPSVDGGRILMHARAPVGTRVEETARLFADIEKVVRQTIPPDELESLVDNIGMSVSSINMTYNNTGTIGSQDGDIQIGLSEEHRPTASYVRTLREVLPARFPGMTFSFLPADIISQILNFGAPAPIEVQVRGPKLEENLAYAQNLLRRLRHVPGLVDARINQSLSEPGFNVDVDRTRAQYVGITERDVTNSLVVDLAGSSQVQPTFWLNPDNGVNYSIVMQTPQYQVDTLNALQNLPITAVGAQPQILGAIADVKRVAVPAIYSHYNIQPVIQIYATTQGRDLGGVAADVQRIINDTANEAPKTADVVMLGQVKTMNSSFSGLFFGLAAAIVLIYLLIVVNFQSWADPFVIITALPAALAGIVWILFATGTTLSVPALTGAIMCMGVATANQRAGRQLRQRTARAARGRDRRRDRSRLHPLAPGADDGARHDHRHVPDGARAGRRRRAKRPARPGRDRRTAFRDGRNSDIRSGRFQHHSSTPRPQGCRRGRRTACRLMQTRLPPLCRGADSISPASRRCSSALSSWFSGSPPAKWPMPSCRNGRKRRRYR